METLEWQIKESIICSTLDVQASFEQFSIWCQWWGWIHEGHTKTRQDIIPGTLNWPPASFPWSGLLQKEHRWTLMMTDKLLSTAQVALTDVLYDHSIIPPHLLLQDLLFWWDKWGTQTTRYHCSVTFLFVLKVIVFNIFSLCSRSFSLLVNC